MRKRSLGSLCLLLSLVIVYGLNYTAGSSGLGLAIEGPVTVALCAMLLAPILLIPLTRLNRLLLAWRKTRGRDIEEEEKYEIGDSDIISLRPRHSDDGNPS
jgi:hypothetical protein